MQIDHIDITLASQVPSVTNGKVRAFIKLQMSSPLGKFVLHDLKIIESRHGIFLAMPSRKDKVRCHHCNKKNEVLARFCNWCGEDLGFEPVADEEDRLKIHSDIFHPIDMPSREALEKLVIGEYNRFLRSQNVNP